MSLAYLRRDKMPVIISLKCSGATCKGERNAARAALFGGVVGQEKHLKNEKLGSLERHQVLINEFLHDTDQAGPGCCFPVDRLWEMQSGSSRLLAAAVFNNRPGEGLARAMGRWQGVYLAASFPRMRLHQSFTHCQL